MTSHQSSRCARRAWRGSTSPELLRRHSRSEKHGAGCVTHAAESHGSDSPPDLFEPPIEDREALLFVARALCGDLAQELGLRGAGAKQVRVQLRLEGSEQEGRESVVRHPLSSAVELFGLIGGWIKEWQPRAPITELWIELPVLETAGRRQLRLWTGGEGTSEEVLAALERLQERHGEGIVRKPRLALLTSPVPAQRFDWVS